MWSASSHLEEKLYGNLEAPRKTAHLISVGRVTLLKGKQQKEEDKITVLVKTKD
jgi:hypothetical protein